VLSTTSIAKNCIFERKSRKTLAESIKIIYHGVTQSHVSKYKNETGTSKWKGKLPNF
jgi:hypothetical protein